MGKSLLALHVAKQMKCPYVKMSGSPYANELDLTGTTRLRGSDSGSVTKFQYGALPTAIHAANLFGTAVLIVNEINLFTQQIQMVFNSLLDINQSVSINALDGEEVFLMPDAHLVVLMTMNPDVAGVNDLQEAFSSRPLYMIIPYPEPDKKGTSEICTKEANILSQITGYAHNDCLPFANYANRLRKMKDIQIPQAPGIREVKRWIEFTPVYGAEFAFEIAIANKCAHGEQQKIDSLMESYKASAEFRLIADLKLHEKTPTKVGEVAKVKKPVTEKGYKI
jgi:MoxR-like ATPase